MKRKILFGLVFTAILFLCSCAHQPCNKNILFQLSNAHIIKQGDFDGRLSLKKLKAKGDFGIGTFDRLDGEMAELDGIIYQKRILNYYLLITLI